MLSIESTDSLQRSDVHMISEFLLTLPGYNTKTREEQLEEQKHKACAKHLYLCNISRSCFPS